MAEQPPPFDSIYCEGCGTNAGFRPRRNPALPPREGTDFCSACRKLQDTFAAAAMQGILSSISWAPGLLVHEDRVADDAYAVAEEMVKRRGQLLKEQDAK